MCPGLTTESYIRGDRPASARTLCTGLCAAGLALGWRERGAREGSRGNSAPIHLVLSHANTHAHVSAAPPLPPPPKKPSLTCMQPVCSTCSASTLIGKEVGLKNKKTLTKINFQSNFETLSHT